MRSSHRILPFLAAALVAIRLRAPLLLVVVIAAFIVFLR